MSLHALPLNRYNTEKMRDFENMGQAIHGTSGLAALKAMDIPNSPMSILPRIPSFILPEDELPRPAVIGLSGSCGSYPDSTTAIKEILASVLNLSRGVKSAFSINTDLEEDSDLENWDHSSNGDSHDDVDSDSGCVALIKCPQKDYRFNRHKASWDNTQAESTPALPVDQHTFSSRITLANALPNNTELEMSPFLKPEHCTKNNLTGPDGNQQGKFALMGLPKDIRRFSSPNILSHSFGIDVNPLYSTSDILTLPLKTDLLDTDLCNSEDGKSLSRKSQSCSSILKASDQTLTASTEDFHQSTENLFEPTVNLENENAHFLVADLVISVVEKMKSSLQSWQYEQWNADGGNGGLQCCKTHPVGCCFSRQKKLSESVTSVDSGYEGLAAMQQNLPTDAIVEKHDSMLASEWQHSPGDLPVEKHHSTHCAMWQNSPSDLIEDDTDSKHSVLWQNSISHPVIEDNPKHYARWQNSPTEDCLENDDSKHTPVCDVYNYDDFVIIEMEDYDKLSMTSAQESSTKTQRPNPKPGSNSAEQTAKNLYRAFRQKWCLCDVESQLSVTPSPFMEKLVNRDSIPEEFESSVMLVEEIRKFRMREAEEWAPPRFQILNIIHPSVKRDVIVASQNYLCVGCGTKVEQRYTNRLRYCEYLGKYFCDCCHSYAESSIPSRILQKWNFSKYYVSNFSKSLVDSIWQSHKFNVQCENTNLYKKVKDLNRVKEVQEKLISIKKLLATCRFATSVLKSFDDFPSHLTEELHLFTLNDLFKVKQKLLLPTLRELLSTAVTHVDNCELCQAKGFICEFCQGADILFPFQTETCRRCEVCKACYHKQCFNTQNCPKCCRIEARKTLKRSAFPDT
ncbi:protein associated with UVRAG as autophagy enhancer [Rhinophrynus dorsalis]